MEPSAARRASQAGLGGGESEMMETQLESKTYGEGVVAALRALQQEDELCDFTVCAGTKSIRVCIVYIIHYSMQTVCLQSARWPGPNAYTFRKNGKHFSLPPNSQLWMVN